jgi:glucosyl-dolichyl phosphate glucuronosyltransferase
VSRLSLIVPTYRRPVDLMRCLGSVQAQTLDDFELVVVDNAADAELARRIDAFNGEARVTARYVAEPRLGLHNARHAGVRAASGDVLVFTDDDATFDPGWLAAYARCFEQHPDMAAAGGPARPVWEVPPPDWVPAYMRTQPAMFPILSLLEPFSEFRLTRDGYFFGVNMAIRREVLIDVGGFNPDSFGSAWLGDGETGLNRKLWERRLLIGYVPDAIVYHHVPAERLTLEYFRRREANDGACDIYARFHAAGVPGRAGLVRTGAAIAAESARDWAASLVLRGRTDPRSLRVQLRAARAWARLLYVWRLLGSAELRELVGRRDWLQS